MILHPLVKMIGDCVKPLPKPTIYLGGFDSVIILHHLSQKTTEEICSYTFGFDDQESECEGASKVAEYYNTKHKNVIIGDLLPTYPEILQHLSRPRLSLFVYWLAKEVHKDGRQNIYIGEGADEHFGGYWYKPKVGYLEQWSNLFIWGIDGYKEIHKIFNLHSEIPFMYLDWRETLQYYDHEQHKFYLRKAYKGILPDFVIERKKNPASRNYWTLWNRELKAYFPDKEPTTVEEIRNLWNALVCKMWLDAKEYSK